MSGVYEHISLSKETIIRDRRSHSVPPPKFKGNSKQHSRLLTGQLKKAKESAILEETPGFDHRLLLKLSVRDSFDPALFESIQGINVVSQENKEIVLLFATDEAMSVFEKRLATYGSTGKVTRKELIEATQFFDLWTAEDRKGEVLRREGLPTTETFILDVELWPLENREERESMLSAFKAKENEYTFSILDTISNNFLTIARCRCNKQAFDKLSRYRDVRTIDLPPRYTPKYSILQTDIEDLPVPKTPSNDAPRVAILDSGVTSGHPLLAPAVGDTRSYINGLGTDDQNGHGTAVAGITLYGDIQSAVESKTFTPHFWILSGRILDGNNEYDETFIENQIEKAVREFNQEYKCRVFNLSIGDANRPYTGGKAGSFPMILDNLAYELGVLFIVSAGNLSKEHILDKMKRGGKKEYPKYLLSESSILEPANAINAITVGSIARYDQSRSSGRYLNDPNYQPVAPRDSVSPFSRIGLGIADCIKPELVAYGGNLGYDQRGGVLQEHGLGELTFNHNFVEGKLLSEKCGTSFATSFITHLAGRLLSDENVNNKSVLLLRALLIGQANLQTLSFPESLSDDERVKMAGYGRVDEEYLYKSGEEIVVLYNSDKINNDKNHFYEIPLPQDFLTGYRKREITVTLSYFSPVKNTRVNYRGIRMFYKFVKGESLNKITQMFDKATPKNQFKNIKEVGSSQNRNITAKARSKGTVQSSTWTLKQPDKKSKYFVVVTRNDHPWGEKISNEQEEYALTIVIRDREQSQPRLYTQIKSLINQRVKARVTTYTE